MLFPLQRQFSLHSSPDETELFYLLTTFVSVKIANCVIIANALAVSFCLWHLVLSLLQDLSHSLQRPMRIVGWYHSHPHITVWPSHIGV